MRQFIDITSNVKSSFQRYVVDVTVSIYCKTCSVCTPLDEPKGEKRSSSMQNDVWSATAKTLSGWKSKYAYSQNRICFEVSKYYSVYYTSSRNDVNPREIKTPASTWRIGEGSMGI